ncbi:MAG TPA: cyclophilin-like fold protein [Mycobacterium sp.]|nr:cyclophilin-like fold protein [Mycobacterium sp.]
MTTIRINVDNRLITAQLADNPTARDLADQLPLTLSFRDFNGVEKIAELPNPLTTEGVPEGDDPDIADIGYYAPDNNIVLYYGDVGYWNGIVRIGRFDREELEFVRNQPDGFEVRIELG